MQKLSDLNFLTPIFPQCKPCLLYADDTLLLLKPNRNEILKIKLLFDIFSRISGLKINLRKFELAINSSHLSLTHTLADEILYKPAAFPIRYLGLPLFDRNLTRIDYLPIIDKVQAKLANWKAPLLFIGGRLILTNVVLAAMSYYFMSVFLLPAWVIRKIDQIRKKFLWHSHKDQQRQLKSLYMVNWNLATKPRDQGGLGIRDIRIANKVLLMKCMWHWHDHNHAWWKQPSQMTNAIDRPWNDTRSSPFWKNMRSIAPAFNCSVQYQIGDGKWTNFWHDNWQGTSLKYKYPNLYQAIQNKQFSVSQCIMVGLSKNKCSILLLKLKGIECC